MRAPSEWATSNRQLLDLERVEQCNEVVDVRPEPVRGRQLVARAAATQIRGDQRCLAGQLPRNRQPDVAAAGDAVHGDRAGSSPAGSPKR